MFETNRGDCEFHCVTRSLRAPADSPVQPATAEEILVFALAWLVSRSSPSPATLVAHCARASGSTEKVDAWPEATQARCECSVIHLIGPNCRTVVVGARDSHHSIIRRGDLEDVVALGAEPPSYRGICLRSQRVLACWRGERLVGIDCLGETGIQVPVVAGHPGQQVGLHMRPSPVPRALRSDRCLVQRSRPC